MEFEIDFIILQVKYFQLRAVNGVQRQQIAHVVVLQVQVAQLQAILEHWEGADVVVRKCELLQVRQVDAGDLFDVIVTNVEVLQTFNILDSIDCGQVVSRKIHDLELGPGPHLGRG